MRVRMCNNEVQQLLAHHTGKIPIVERQIFSCAWERNNFDNNGVPHN